MPEFKSWRSYFLFETAVKYKARYVREPEVGRISKRCACNWPKSESEFLPPQAILWRAQLGFDWEPLNDENGEHIDNVPSPNPPARMKPLLDRASEGRANPTGIPRLYMATDRDTAMAEVRPWIGSHISIAQMKTRRPLKLLDCSAKGGMNIWLEEPPVEKREEAIWWDINAAFAKPVTRSDDVADYAPGHKSSQNYSSMMDSMELLIAVRLEQDQTLQSSILMLQS